MIEVPLLRIQESDSTDLESVAQCSPRTAFPATFLNLKPVYIMLTLTLPSRYYSSHIVAFIRLCLEVVPVTMFRILTDQVVYKGVYGCNDWGLMVL